jgi:branched-chain amino acid transport system ATP-binding protein
VEQNIPATLKFVQRAMVLKAGRIVFDGPSAELEDKANLWGLF